jgi:ankyrin repeat protein
MRTTTTLLLIFIFSLFWGCGNQESVEKEANIAPPKLDLHAAIYMKDHDAIKQHIKIGSDLNAPEPTRGSSPLITAAALDEPEAAQLLIDAGADINRKNNDGSTALLTAIVFGKTRVAKVLIDAGANLKEKSKDGSTALHTSAFFCREEIVKALLEKGADKTILNRTGKTAYETVAGPFKDVKPVYDAIGEGLKPLGIEFDYDHIEKTRPIIAEMLK